MAENAGKRGKFHHTVDNVITIQGVLRNLSAVRDSEDTKDTHSFKQSLRDHRISACDSLTNALKNDAALAKKLEKIIYKHYALTGAYEEKITQSRKYIESHSEIYDKLLDGSVLMEDFLDLILKGPKKHVRFAPKTSQSTPPSPKRSPNHLTVSHSHSAPTSPQITPVASSLTTRTQWPSKSSSPKPSPSNSKPKPSLKPQPSKPIAPPSSTSSSSTPSSSKAPPPKSQHPRSPSNLSTKTSKKRMSSSKNTSAKSKSVRKSFLGKAFKWLDDFANFVTVWGWFSGFGLFICAAFFLGFYMWTPTVDTYFHATNLNSIPHEEFQDRDIYNMVYNIVKDGPGFTVIYGSHNVGKSTLVRKAAEEVSEGVLYVDISDYADENLSTILSSMIELNLYSLNVMDYVYSYLIGRTQTSDDELDALSLVLDYIYDGAKEYERDHLTIVIDSFNLMYNRQPETLDHLHAFFSQSNKAGDLRTVLVCDESIHHKILGTQSFEDAFILKIDRANPKESLNYLKKLGITDERHAREIFDLTGGNFANLQRAAKFEKVQDAAKFFFRRCEHRLMQLGVLSPHNEQHSLAIAMWTAFYQITESSTESIPLSLFESIFSSVTNHEIAVATNSENSHQNSPTPGMGLRDLHKLHLQSQSAAQGSRSEMFLLLFSEDEHGHVFLSDKPMFHYVQQRLAKNEKLRKLSDQHSSVQIESISDLVQDFQYISEDSSLCTEQDHLSCKDAQHKSTFSVTIKRGSITEKTFAGKSPPDLYCTLKTLSKTEDILVERQTKIINNDFEAAWEEYFGEWDHVQEIDGLEIELWDHDRYNEDDLMGKITLSFEELDGDERTKVMKNGVSLNVIAKLSLVE